MTVAEERALVVQQLRSLAGSKRIAAAAVRDPEAAAYLRKLSELLARTAANIEDDGEFDGDGGEA